MLSYLFNITLYLRTLVLQASLIHNDILSYLLFTISQNFFFFLKNFAFETFFKYRNLNQIFKKNKVETSHRKNSKKHFLIRFKLNNWKLNIFGKINIYCNTVKNTVLLNNWIRWNLVYFWFYLWSGICAWFLSYSKILIYFRIRIYFWFSLWHWS